MATILGLDIGSNSVGSAWIDTEQRLVKLGVSVFPAGVEDDETKRGAPKNQARREARSQRRSLRRRAERKARLRQFLTELDFLPHDAKELEDLFGQNPWRLRAEALARPLSAHEFGRVLVHLGQRRGALGLSVDADDEEGEEGRVKEAVDRTRQMLAGRTFGQFIDDEMRNRVHPLPAKPHRCYSMPVRNRKDSFEFHADRALIREEFQRIWAAQASFGGELGPRLTDALFNEFDRPVADDTWRHKGYLFGQRRTYWRIETLGRCALEPTDRCCPAADMYAQEFLVLETVNNIRLRTRGGAWEQLDAQQRAAVIDKLSREENGSVAKVRQALGIDKRTLKKKNLPESLYELSLEADPDRTLNTNWFFREVVLGCFGAEAWQALPADRRDAVNRAILAFDPDDEADAARLRVGVSRWFGLSDEAAATLVAAWRGRPKVDSRISLSRKALLNLMPYLRSGQSVSEARQAFAASPAADPQQQKRYALGAAPLNKAGRQFLRKHPDLLPPAPKLSNPVVRKAIHEVRRHVNEYIRLFGRIPDQVVVELAREARQSAKVRNDQLNRNRRRERIRNAIIEQFGLNSQTSSQQQRAVDRILLCRQQKGVCPYSGRPITEEMAKAGNDLEIDHIVPRSLSNDNGLNNKVLCFTNTNRGKGNLTLKVWLGAESVQYEQLLQRMRHLSDRSGSDEYFSPREGKRKWENLLRDAPASEEFQASQLVDTAYASRQVAAYLRDALYAGDPDPARRVFTTKGGYTAILRRDWGLVESALERQLRHGANLEAAAESGEPGVARRDGKDRSDHLHHAIDAVAIAFCTRQTIQEVARVAAQQEALKGQLGYWLPREPIPAPEPWKGVQEFRIAVLDQVQKIIVAHRPVKRRLAGALHNQSLFGPVSGDAEETRFTRRIWVWRNTQENLKPVHLRMPEGWAALSRRLEEPGLPQAMRNAIQRELAGLPDPPPTKSGIVRDRALRDQLRTCLVQNGLDPDAFNQNQIKQLVLERKVHLASGVPVKSVVLLRTISDPVLIPGKRRDLATGKMVVDDDWRTTRVYDSQSNHHIEIREDPKTGRWQGKVVRTFDAARRLQPPRPPDGTRPPPLPAVNREEVDGKRFVMSLAEGETIYARRRDRPADAPDAVGYFVVAKLDPSGAIHFAPHWDARPADQQDRWNAPASILKSCGVVEGQPPYKVHVGPLGDVQRLDD